MSEIPQSVIVHPAEKLGGTIEVPGDKSISHRVGMLAAIASGESIVHNFLHSEDCINTLRAMEALGARSYVSEDGVLTIHGTGGKLLEPAGPLNCGNSGTTIRLLAGLAAGQAVTIEMTGDESLCSRPMGRIKEPLERMGAKLELTGEKGTPPVKIQGGALKAIDYILPVASAQVKSAILLATLFAEGTTTITEPLPSRDHTERMLRSLGVPVIVDGLQIKLRGFGPKGPQMKAREFLVPGDFSSAAFMMMAVAARAKGKVTIKKVGLNPRRTAFLDVLKRAGADVVIKPRKTAEGVEPIGDITIRGGALKAVEVGGAEIPNLIDELPLVAVLGALAEGTTVINNAQELRVKETDRIAAMVSNLRSLGVDAEAKDDGMIIRGGSKITPTTAVKSLGDHRIAMSMAILALYGTAPVVINNVACVDTSYPGFWQHLRDLGGHVE
jgi:3-phosphoshikimate 1-carboxyvinyltransferase